MTAVSLRTAIKDALSARVLLATLGYQSERWLELEPTAEAFLEAFDQSGDLNQANARSAAGDLTPAERTELDAYARIEHLLVLLKAGTLRAVAPAL